MFKTASFEDEIYRSMEKALVKNQSEEKHGFGKLAQAIDNLNAAAEIFEQAGMSQPAAEITEVLQDLATEQLASKAFSVSDLASIDKGTLHDLLEHSTPAQLMNVAKKVMSVVKGEKSTSDVVDETIKEHDLTDPKVRDRVIKQIMMALQVAKFFA